MSRKIILQPKSLLGKNRIREHGESWEIVEERDFAHCCKGAGFRIRSTKTGHERWINQINDGDFLLLRFEPNGD